MQLLPEWYPQEAVVLAWPDELTDWQQWLDTVQDCFIDLISALLEQTPIVILLARPDQHELIARKTGLPAGLRIVTADYNDTWARDYTFLTAESEQGKQAISFSFNGWGQKFAAGKDNAINQSVLAEFCQLPLLVNELVLEGGALEIDAEGTLLSTSLCLLNPARNGAMPLAEYQHRLMEMPGAKRVIILENGHLEGDDTDGHIDTLVRFTPHKSLVIQSAFNSPADSHYDGLAALVKECRSAFPEHQIHELPLPCIQSQEGLRLPASYANFLINNRQVLCPVYGAKEDEQALAILARAFPDHSIRAVNCRSLIGQFGSLHCVTMQIPQGTLKPAFLNGTPG